MPPFDAARYHEPAVAIRSGEILWIPRTGIVPALADLVDAMLLGDSTQRPTIAQVHATLMGHPPPQRQRPTSGSDHHPAPKGGCTGSEVVQASGAVSCVAR